MMDTVSSNGVGEDRAGDVHQHAAAEVRALDSRFRCIRTDQHRHGGQGKKHHEQILQGSPRQGDDAGHVDHQKHQGGNFVKAEADAPVHDDAVQGDGGVTEQRHESEDEDASVDLPALL